MSKQKFLSSLENDEGLEQPLAESVISFADKCCEITWLMTVQSPPMYIECDVKTGSTFNSDLMAQYTRSGPNVEFVVWPVVYIEKNGALLSKGVAQPTKND
ncbi:hypothetical protein FSP39_008120 [Pinctada imbricata]|uniref:Mitochondria-eating protein C-terminal domain-containing protein n=1 Tax=Pinctada imbricata TaxID=66713 RepID=A0AA88YD27_PINIB|nr:hypothetical protein FSP39_008120 [Pinctada imbricata]